MADNDDCTLISELTRRLQEADTYIQRLQDEQAPMRNELSVLSKDVLSAKQSEEHSKAAMDRMELSIEDLLAPSLSEVRDVRKQILSERAEADQIIGDLRDELHQSGIIVSTTGEELEAVQHTLASERSSFKQAMDQLQESVSEMSAMMEKSLSRNRLLEEQHAQSSQQCATLGTDHEELERVVLAQDVRLVQSKEAAAKLQHELDRAEAQHLGERAELQQSLKDAQAAETSLERQLHAVKASMTRSEYQPYTSPLRTRPAAAPVPAPAPVRSDPSQPATMCAIAPAAYCQSNPAEHTPAAGGTALRHDGALRLEPPTVQGNAAGNYSREFSQYLIANSQPQSESYLAPSGSEGLAQGYFPALEKYNLRAPKLDQTAFGLGDKWERDRAPIGFSHQYPNVAKHLF